jgi:ATP-dependent Clp protease protease subunit
MKETLNKILAFHTGKNLEQIQLDTDRDFFMAGDEAKEYGIIDHVIINRDDFDHLENAEA